MRCEEVSKKQARNVLENIGNTGGYPFQKYEVLTSPDNAAYSIRFKSRIEYLCIYEDDNTPLLLAPIRCYYGKNKCSIIGTQECFDIVDCIYKELSVSRLAEAYQTLFGFLKEKSFNTLWWDWIAEDSESKKALEILKSMGIIQYSKEPVYNVKIETSNFDTFDDYFNSLSKNVRQNVRTAYNRLDRDRKNISLNYFIGKSDKKSTLVEGLLLYLRGQKVRYDHSGLSYWAHFGLFHYVTKTMNTDYSFHASLMIDGDMVAMMQGYVDENRHALQIPRLAINPQYSFYSPGYVMVCQVIKKMFEEKQYQTLDLMRGCEKYKTDLGGTKYPTYKTTIEIV